MPTVLVAAWSQWRPQRLAAFDDRVAPPNVPLVQLLNGEHLVPPPPLPPEVFLTPDLAATQPWLASADRRWDQMDNDFVQAV
ncbi:hypothetical protein ABTN30_20045, partial [Acinetobacter baumannii]